MFDKVSEAINRVFDALKIESLVIKQHTAYEWRVVEALKLLGLAR